MKNVYPEQVGDDYRTVAWMVRGHVDLEEFRLAVQRVSDCDASEVGDCFHEYWRVIPNPPGSEFDLRYLTNQAPGPGAFKVTCVYWD